MSALLAGKAMRTKVGDRGAKQVLEHLANYADENDRAWPSVSTLACECECSVSTVQRSLRLLEERGLIARDFEYGTRYGADRSPYVYHITLDGAEQVTYERLRAKAKSRERAKAKRGGTGDTPRGSVHDTPRGSTHDTPRGSTGDTSGVAHMTPRGVAPTTKRGSTHDTQTFIEHPLRTSRESTRASKTGKPRAGSEAEFNRRVDRLLALTPDETHLALAARYGLDADLELEKFVDRCRAEGKPPADPKAAFRNWLRRAPELGIGVANPSSTDTTALAGIGSGVSEPGDGDVELRRRARKMLDSSRPIARRIPERAARLDLVPGVARLLGRGMSPVDIVNLIASGGPQELADAGIELDDLEAIA